MSDSLKPEQTPGWDARDRDLLERINTLLPINVNNRPYVSVEWVTYAMKCMAISRHRYRIEELESHRDVLKEDESGSPDSEAEGNSGTSE